MSDKVRVYEIAEEAGASSQDVITKAKDLGIELKSPQSAVSFEDAEEIANYIMTGKSSKISDKSPSKIKKTIKKEDTKENEKVEVLVEKKEKEEILENIALKGTSIDKLYEKTKNNNEFLNSMNQK